MSSSGFRGVGGWGENDTGQLGDGAVVGRLEPEPVIFE